MGKNEKKWVGVGGWQDRGLGVGKIGGWIKILFFA